MDLLRQFPSIYAAIPIHQTVNILFGVAWSHTPPFVAESLCKLHQDTGPVEHIGKVGTCPPPTYFGRYFNPIPIRGHGRGACVTATR